MPGAAMTARRVPGAPPRRTPQPPVPPVPRSRLGLLLGPALLLGGCDPSRPELEATRQRLAAMTAERDGALKQVAALSAELQAARKAAKEEALRHGETVKHEVYTAHGEAPRSGLKGEASFLALTSQPDFDQVFATPAAPAEGQRAVPKDAFTGKIIVAAIRRGPAPLRYTVDRVSAGQGILYVQYQAAPQAGAAGAPAASPLILAVDKGPYASVGFIENGKLVGTASIGN